MAFRDSVCILLCFSTLYLYGEGTKISGSPESGVPVSTPASTTGSNCDFRSRHGCRPETKLKTPNNENQPQMVDADERSLERLQRVPAVSDIHSTNKLAGNGYVSSQSTNISPDKSKSTIKLSPPDLNYRPPAGHWLDSPIELESAEQIGGLPEQGDVVQIGKDYTGISRNGPFFSVLKPTPPSKTRVRRSSDRSPCGDVRDKVACFNRVLLAVATYKAKDRSSVKHFIGRQIKNQRYPPPSSWAEVNPPNDGTDIGQWKRSYKRGLDLMSRDLRSNGILSFCSPGMPIEVCIKWLRMRYDKV